MVTNFIKGKRYIIENYSLISNTEWLLPCSYAKITYSGGETIIIEKYTYIHNDISNGVLKLSQNYINERYIIYGLKKDVDIEQIEFVYDYDEENSIEKTVSDILKDYCNLVIKKPLVSIWFAENAEWVDLPCPSDYNGISTTLVDSARNTQGQVIGQVIASDIAKVELKWNFLTAQEYSYMAKQFEQKYLGSFFVAVSFFDVIKNDWDGSTETSPSGKDGNNPCRVFYCGDRKVQFAKMVLNDDGTPKGYSSVSLNLIDTGKYYGE